MNSIRLYVNSILVTVLILFSSGSSANALCPNGEIFDGSLATDICWTCMLPIRLFGASELGLAEDQAVWDDHPHAPDNAYDEPLCDCWDPDTLQYKFGFTSGMLMPTKLVETVKTPFCSPILGGAMVGKSTSAADSIMETVGTRTMPGFDATEKTRYQQHIFTFPILYIMKAISSFSCLPGGYTTVDMWASPTEFNPIWNNDELAAMLQPHAKLFSSPEVQMTCALDAYASTFDRPTEQLYCNGGDLIYPLHGNVTDPVDLLRTENLTTARNIEIQHNLGIIRSSTGSDSMCGDAPYTFTRPKQQYKFNLMFPLPEARASETKDCCHYLGAYAPTFGAGKILPGPGENIVSVLFQWVDCCVFTF